MKNFIGGYLILNIIYYIKRMEKENMKKLKKLIKKTNLY